MRWVYISILFLFVISTANAVERLPALGIESKGITVSGVSAGGFMAAQLHVALSSQISGVGVVAGGSYWCSEGVGGVTGSACMTTPWLRPVLSGVNHARREASQGRIDSLNNLNQSRVYIYGSPVDTVMNVYGSSNLAEFYEHFVPSSQIKRKHDFYSAHGFPTRNSGASCAVGGYPWLLNCGFDLAGDILQHLYTQLQPPQKNGEALGGHLYWYDQSEFATAFSGLANAGQIYIPEECRSTKCRLHISLHGCGMSPAHVGTFFNEHVGLNEWADVNHFVVLYPAVAATPVNPGACWDWVGYTGSHFANKYGPQIQALIKMIGRLK